MGSGRTFILITAAAVALPSIAAAQEQTIFVTSGAMQDREQRVTVFGAAQDREQRVTVFGAAQDREQRVTVFGAVQDREQRVTVFGAADDQRSPARAAANRPLPTIPVVYEDEPAPAAAPARPAAPARASAPQPNR